MTCKWSYRNLAWGPHSRFERLSVWCAVLIVGSSLACAQNKPNLTGTWTGSFASASGDSGPITVTFSQVGNSIMGSLTVPGSSCVGSGGSITGQLTPDPANPGGWLITFGNVAVAGGVGANAISFTGTVDSATQLNGTFNVNPPCTVDSGIWNLFTVSSSLLASCADCVHAPGLIVTNFIPMWSVTTPPTLTDSNLTQDATGSINLGPYLHLGLSDGTVQSIGPGSGVIGRDTNASGNGAGLIGFSDGDNGAGVFGRATACSPSAAPCLPTSGSPSAGITAGVRGVADGLNGYGVRGFAGASTGTTHGVEGRVVSNGGHGVEGWNTSNASDGAPIGVFGRTFGAKGIAVSGQATTAADISTDNTIGVLGQAKTGTAGFSGLDQGVGAWGANFSATGFTRGVLAQIFSPGGEAIAAEAPQGGNLIVGRGSPNYTTVFRVSNSGAVFADGGLNTSGADFAESLRIGGQREDYAPGDVLVIDSSASRQVTRSSQPYSTLVAGIYSTKPGVLASPHAVASADLAKEVPLAIVGIVPCKVSAENGPIEPGDLLVTAATPGHAMRGTDRGRMLGAVMGKALQPMREGTGVIEVLVTLQ